MTVTKKVGYDGRVDVKRGICGYGGCREKVPATTVEDPNPISRPEHDETYEVAYSYLPCQECQDKYNTDVEFAESFDSSHGVIHVDHEKPCDEGEISSGTEHLKDVGRDYGAYDLKEPLEWHARCIQNVTMTYPQASQHVCGCCSSREGPTELMAKPFAPTLPSKSNPAHHMHMPISSKVIFQRVLLCD